MNKAFRRLGGVLLIGMIAGGLAQVAASDSASAQVTTSQPASVAEARDRTPPTTAPHARPAASDCEVAAYYFPGYHPDPRMESLKGQGWTEWDLVRGAVPRFEGHIQPKVPLWGCEDEADPNAMARKIGAAADHGVTAFIFDWYWYEDAPFLDGALDRGFLKAPNRDRLRFALMWANHDWMNIFPAQAGVAPKLLYPGAVNRQVFDHVVDTIITRYFSQPNYWKIDGRPYFSIYELWTLVAGLGGVEPARTALDGFRAKVRAAGFPGLHLNAVGWGQLTPEMVTALGIDSVTTYSWIHHVGLPDNTPYARWAQQSAALWPTFEKKWPVPYFPNVSMGWDNTPRYAWAKMVSGNTPAEFRNALAAARTYLDAQPHGPKVLTINAWNEWTEGSYLEPDTANKMGYLEALRDVFSTAERAATKPNQPTSARSGSVIVPAREIKIYSDGRPAAKYRLDAQDQGVVLRHGEGPNQCDTYGAREAIVFKADDTYYLHYDGAGPAGWVACLATSPDLVTWTRKGPVLELGQAGEDDCGSASSPWVIHDGDQWHMFYLATPHTTPPPDRIPSFPYLTRKAKSHSPAGPWIKQKGVVPFTTRPGTYYADTASPGCLLKHGDEYLMFFSGSMPRTLGIARTRDLDGTWTIDPQPIVPPAEQIENSSLYFQEADATWFLFTNHIGIDARGEYTDAVWVYWSKDLNHWNRDDKAVVLDGNNCRWSTVCLGMPSVIPVNGRLAVFYDAPGDHSVSHMHRDIGLAWLDLPLVLPSEH